MFASQPMYEEISVIGTGAYGTVYKGIDLKTSKIVAMKRIRIKVTDEGLPISTVREIAYLRHLEKYDHDNIVKLLDVCHGPRLNSEQNIILIFEYIDFDLETYMRRFTSNLSLEKIMDLMKQILVGVDFLHTNRIIHRDLKPQNILITKDCKVKIADFGLARVYSFSMTLTSVVVTLWYRSPEVLLQSSYSASIDMWSVGCIFAELYLRRPLFCGNSDIDQLYKIFGILGLPSDKDWPVQTQIPRSSFINNEIKFQKKQIESVIPNIDDGGKSLLLKLLDYNIGNRITARGALLHKYFKHDAKKNENLLDTASSSSASASLFTDTTNTFQPNILKRKRLPQTNQQQQLNQVNENDDKMDTK